MKTQCPTKKALRSYSESSIPLPSASLLHHLQLHRLLPFSVPPLGQFTVHVVDPTPWPLGSLTSSMTQSSTPPYSQDQSLVLDHTNKHSPSITPTLSLPSSNHPLHSRTLMPTTQWPTIFLLTLIPLMPSLASLPLNPQLSSESPYHSELPVSPASITQDPNFSSLLAVPETPWTCSHCRAIAVFSCFPPKNCPLTVPTVNWNCVVSIFH